MTPHSRPSTMTGAPALERMPSSRTASTDGPEAREKSSIRAGPPAQARAHPAAAVLARRAPARHVRHGAVRVVPGQGGHVGAEQTPDLGGDRGEHVLWRRSPGDEHGDPAQRGLLFGDPVACSGLHQGLHPG